MSYYYKVGNMYNIHCIFWYVWFVDFIRYQVHQLMKQVNDFAYVKNEWVSDIVHYIIIVTIEHRNQPTGFFEWTTRLFPSVVQYTGVRCNRERRHRTETGQVGGEGNRTNTIGATIFIGTNRENENGKNQDRSWKKYKKA